MKKRPVFTPRGNLYGQELAKGRGIRRPTMTAYPPGVPSAAASHHGHYLAVSIQDYEALASTREAFVDFLLAPAQDLAGLAHGGRSGTAG
jgi:hypothetical protein